MKMYLEPQLVVHVINIDAGICQRVSLLKNLRVQWISIGEEREDSGED